MQPVHRVAGCRNHGEFIKFASSVLAQNANGIKRIARAIFNRFAVFSVRRGYKRRARMVCVFVLCINIIISYADDGRNNQLKQFANNHRANINANVIFANDMRSLYMLAQSNRNQFAMAALRARATFMMEKLYLAF